MNDASSITHILYPPATESKRSGTDSKRSTETAEEPWELAAALYPRDDVENIQAPEGFDAADMPKIVEVARKFGLSASAAQKLLNEAHASQIEERRAIQDASAKNQEALRSDPDYGGRKFQDSLNRAKYVVERFEARVPGLKAKLEGVMDDAVIVRFLNVIADSAASGAKS